MRKTLTATAFVLATALLTGCGGGEAESASESKGKTPTAQQSEKPKDSGSGAVKQGAPHEVTIEVKGTGTGNVMFTLDDSGFEQVTLPWTKTATIAARGAEQQVGRLVIVTPGNMTRPDGKIVAAQCSITVDGKKVAESKDDSGKPCSYKLK
ncbi:hypothetical protein ACFT7S_06985 [Streptomyces sp. NPDC057136]|uniref:hypothetical protein n=1 Tax=Streptomyces sp. NPDC057136 TaxID=3346029 RepID=UPI00362B8C42